MTNTRVQALDVTRGIAVFGMIFMNFKISVLFDYNGGYSFLGSQEGRFGALFIFLAGMGISLMNRKAIDNPDLLKKNRIKLAKRALYLFTLGMIFSFYWQADIFHFYAFYMLIAIPLIKLSKRALFSLAVIPPIIFLIFALFGNWETGWNWETLRYSGFYTIPGFFRNLAFNGFHPIFPWFSFMLMGMSVGKSDLTNKKQQKINCMISAAVMFGCELVSGLSNIFLSSSEELYLLSTRAMPPLPLFVISAGAQNILILNLILLISAKTGSESKIMKLLSETGKMVMTHYVLHLIIGLIPLFILHQHFDFSNGFVLLYSVAYFIITVWLTSMWRKKFSHGPFEKLMRKLTD
ncbi:MAG: heparan-alpha-glucosaminide N-acetyltransferase domain-containing protein [Spirochaetales bacterium]|nr:heparan-alpha-glucosaminide N-acetyltransferase domain-containing protein [Spirochaetales bacterium]